MATTTNYGWTTPDDSSLVKDGAAAIRTLGSSIDTSLNTALGTKKAGMVLLNTTSFSGVTSVSLPANTFTSSYRNYRVLIESNGASASGAYTCRFRTAGSDVTSGNYQVQELYGSGATAGAGRAANGTNWNNGNVYTEKTCMIIDLFAPQVATSTAVLSCSMSNVTSTTPEITWKIIGFNSTNQFDSLSWISSGANISGLMHAYGYNA